MTPTTTAAFKYRHHLLITAILILSFSTVALSQDRWSLSARPGIDFATSKIAGAEAKTGFGFEGTIGYRFMPHLGAYAGWSWNRFAAKQPVTNAKMDFEETGYNYGLQFTHPIKNTRLSYLVKVGGLYNHIEVENDKGDIVGDTGHGFGWEAEAGVSLELGKNWTMAPGLRYRSLSRDLKSGSSSAAANLNYVSLGVNFSWHF